MGLRVESVLILLIVTVLTVTLSVKIINKEKNTKVSTKELEFTNATFTEVDTNKTIGVAYGTYGIRDKGILTINNFRYSSKNVKDLSSKTAIYRKDKIYLNNNVIFNQKEGYNYYTDHAVYSKNRQILTITSPYKAVMEKNIIYGDTLKYYIKDKKVFSTNINATLYTKETTK